MASSRSLNLQISDSQTLMHQGVRGSFLDGPLIERYRIPGFSGLDEREAKIGQGWHVTRFGSDDFLK